MTSIEIKKNDAGLKQEDVKLLIQTSPTFAVRCLKELFKYQTRDEQEYEQTKENNNVGFNGIDAEILSSFAKQILRYESETQHRYQSPLSPKQMALLIKKLPKYSKQLSQILSPTTKDV